MLHGGEWLAKKYASFAQPKATQTLETTLVTLASRLQDAGNQEGRPGPPLPPLPDRKAAILTLRGLARDHPAEVGAKALDAILESLCRDASLDDDLARAIVELCLTLCEDGAQVHESSAQPTDTKERKPQAHAVQNVERFLTTPNSLHALLPLLSPKRSFYTRFSSLQLLSVLLRIRPDRVQEHVLTSPGGCGIILECLSEGTGSSAEIVRNEALLLLPQLVAANADIQKLVAFEGAFEKLIDVVAIEGRIEGGVVVQDALEALVALLKYNVSNQNYFRETLSVPLLAPLLFYPPPPSNDNPEVVEEYTMQLEAFAFQQWYPPTPPLEETNDQEKDLARPQIELDEQKVINASLVLEVAALLLEGQGDSKRMNQNALLSCGFTRCLLDLSLGSTAPVPLRTQALHVLANLLRSNRSNQDLLNTILVSPIVKLGSASHGTNVEGSGGIDYSRLPPRSAVLELVVAAVNGAPTATEASDALAYRCAALACFDAYVNDNLDARLTILRTMALTPDSIDGDGHASTAGPLLLQSMTEFPSVSARSAAEVPFDAYRSLLGSLLFTSLVKGSETAKEEARSVVFGADGKSIGRINFAEVAARRSKQGSSDDDDDGNSLLQLLLGNLTIALREHADATRRERGAGNKATMAEIHGKSGSSKDWTRIQIGYLIIIITWLWESRPAVEELLKESSNLQVLIQPVSQSGNMTDPIVSGLCAAALGIAYEFGPAVFDNEDPTTTENNDLVVTRATMFPIFQSRIGPDQFAARLTRLRDDYRFKNTGPDVLERMGRNIRHAQGHETKTLAEELDGLWFEWSFVDFIKSNYVQIQKSILIEPNTTAASQASQTTELLDAKRQLEYYRELHGKAEEDIQQLRQHLDEIQETSHSERETLVQALQSAKTEIERLHEEIQAMEQTREQDDRSRQEEYNFAHERLHTVQQQFQAAEQARMEAEENAHGLQSKLTQARQHVTEANARVAAVEREVEHANNRTAAAAAAAASHQTSNGDVSTVIHDDGEGDKSTKAALEQELEDLLILLDELSTKRKRDKRRMQQKGMEVSDDEDDEEDLS